MYLTPKLRLLETLLLHVYPPQHFKKFGKSAKTRTVSSPRVMSPLAHKPPVVAHSGIAPMVRAEVKPARRRATKAEVDFIV